MDKESVSEFCSGAWARVACSHCCGRLSKQSLRWWNLYLPKIMRSLTRCLQPEIKATGLGPFNPELEAHGKRALERSFQDAGKTTAIFRMFKWSPPHDCLTVLVRSVGTSGCFQLAR